jgi:hypothetical protein
MDIGPKWTENALPASGYIEMNDDVNVTFNGIAATVSYNAGNDGWAETNATWDNMTDANCTDTYWHSVRRSIHFLMSFFD